MNETKKSIWKPIAIVSLVIALVACVAVVCLLNRAPEKEIVEVEVTPVPTAEPTAEPTAAPTAEPTAAPLSLWSDGYGAKQSLIDYVTAVTSEGSKDFIPAEDRIAVFDMDGTLTCETYYTYYDTMMFIEYCLVDHPERVSDELKAVAASIQPGYLADETLARNFAKAYAGMTVEEFSEYVVEFGKKYTKSFENMRYIDNMYLPMAELVEYLYDNSFTIWVISGTERTTTRAIVANSPIKDFVRPEHVIGTDFEVKCRGHEDEPSNMNFKYETGDELVLTGGFVQKNLNANKTIYIEREIGQRPVLAFGNTGSDTSMMNYTIDARNPYPAQAYMVVADDTVREWGKQDWDTKSAEYIAKGYVPISMKSDFAMIYPDGIVIAKEQYVPIVLDETPAIAAESAAQQRETDVRLRVFETSDIHGYLMDTSSGKEDTFQYRLAYIAHIVNEARASGEYDDVLLLDGGDIYQGTPPSNLLYGAALRAAMDTMRYDATVLGNHEFDWDVTAYCADADGTLPPYAIGPFSGDPTIPVLAANLYDKATGQRVPFTKDYVVLEKAGVRIALIGYIPDYSLSIMTSKIAPYSIDDDLSRFSARVKQINADERPDVTIVMAHARPIEVAEALDIADVQLVTGGHTHVGIFGIASNGIPYIQPDKYVQGYASATIVIAPDGTIRVEEPLYTAITENKEALYDTPENADHLDADIIAISHAAWEAVGDEMSEVLGYITAPVEKKGVTGDNGSTTGGNWVTGLMLRATRDMDTVAAFYNTGGIRTSFEIPEGETRRNVTVGDIYSIAPFGNYLFVYELTGAELAQQLKNGFISRNFGDQMSGLTFEYTAQETESGTEITILSITLDDGTTVDTNDETTLYRVCTSNYSATLPGSVFENKTPLIPASEAPVDNVAFIDLLRQEAKENNGLIFVDAGPRGYLVDEAAAALATAAESDVNLSGDASDFVLLSEAVPDAILEIRYYSTYNFIGDRIDGYEEPLAILTKEAAAALKEVSDELVGMGYRLKIFDAYRPQRAVTNFMNWALDPDDARMKEYFYPELEKSQLFPQGYIAEHSGHSRGSTVDLTLFDMTTEREVDMGGTFDYFGQLSHPDYTDITEEQYAMRMLLREVMVKHGFKPLEEEWWHFTLENEPFPDTYFTFPINSDSVAPAA